MTRSSSHVPRNPGLLVQTRRSASPQKRASNMAPSKDVAALSDAETSEGPVREQFKKASIAGLPQDQQNGSAGVPVVEASADSAAPTVESGENGSGSPRGRVERKRSFDEVEGEGEAPAITEVGGGKLRLRKRSRDSTAEELELNGGQRKTSGERLRDDHAHGATTSNGMHGNGEGVITGKRAATPEDRQADSVPDEETIASPKTKRSRLHSTVLSEKNGDIPAEKPTSLGDDIPAVKTSEDPTSSLPSIKGPTPQTSSKTQSVPATSGFANTSAASPFGAFSPRPSESSTTSAFASSAFGTLATSSSSGFGAMGKTSGGFGAGGGFATGGKSPLGAMGAENEKPTEEKSSAFGGALGAKSAFGGSPAKPSGGFGSGASGFGQLGGAATSFGGTTTTGFGALGGAGTLGGGGGLSTFASSSTSKPSGSSTTTKPARAFGAPPEENEDEANAEGTEDHEGDDSGVKSPAHGEGSERTDPRFYAQDLATGEEDETTIYSCRAKLYNFAVNPTPASESDGPVTKKEWRERGLGVLRLNVRYDERAADDAEKVEDGGEDGGASADRGQVKARLLMRADGSHRVVLNTPVLKAIQFGAPGGGQPVGGYIHFMGTVADGAGLELLQLKVSLPARWLECEIC